MTPPVRPFRIIPCNEWGAQPPRHAISDAGVFNKALFHHTAGHHPELDHAPGESYGEAVAYARAIQFDHLRRDNNTWADTGNNFLVSRAGYIFEGRHRSLELLGRGHCPVSAHCPGQNDQPGVEIEHYGNELMTPLQLDAAVWLFTKICREGSFGSEMIFGHRDFWATACPGPLYAQLPAFRRVVGKELEPHPRPAGRYRTPPWFVNWAEWWLHGADPDTKPAGVPATIPPRAFKELDKIGQLYISKQGGQQ